MYTYILMQRLAQFSRLSIDCDQLETSTTCAHCIRDTLRSITCVLCNKCLHIRCYEQPYNYREVIDSWYCAHCIADNFPFNHIVEERVFLECVTDHVGPFCNIPDDLELNLFPGFSESRSLLNNEDIDPDTNYFEVKPYSSCYLTPASAELKFSSSLSLFSIMNINCRSILSKLPEIHDLLHQLPVSILAVTETWLNAENADQVNIPGYHFIHKPRVSGQGGGVGVFIKEGISFHRCEALESKLAHNSYEGLFIQVSLNKETTIYRPPGQCLDDFSNEFE